MGFIKNATVVEQVDTPDLKSCGQLPVPVRLRPVVRKKKIIYLYQMKKVLFIAALVTLASCSSETKTISQDTLTQDTTVSDSTTCKDSVCADSTK